MKKCLAGALALVMAAAVLGGCGKEYVKLGEYKGIEINVPLMEGNDLEVETLQFYFNNVLERSQITDRPVKLYDMAHIDYEGKKDGVAFAGGTAQGADLLIGSGQFINGFEDGLIGVMPGETVDLNLTFPESYGNAELAGQEVVFTVKVHYVSEMEDERAAALGIENVATAEQLREYIRDSRYHSDAEAAVLSRIVSEAVFEEELPKDMMAKNRELYANFLSQIAQAYGMDASTFAAAQGLDYESLLAQYAEEYTRQQLVIEAIADREELNISDQDLDTRMSEYAEKAGLTVEELLVNGVTKEDFRENFLYEDVMDFLVEHAVNTAAE